MRIAGAIWMFAFLLWLPFEDTQIGMAAALALAGVVWLAFRLRPWIAATWWHAALGGGLSGAAIPLFAISLMVLYIVWKSVGDLRRSGVTIKGAGEL